MCEKFQYIQVISELEEEKKKKKIEDNKINSNLTDFISENNKKEDKQKFDKS